MEMMIWNLVLSSLVGVMIWVLKEKFVELDRLGILINKTREEIAREHITRREVRDDMEKLHPEVRRRVPTIGVKN